MRPRRKKARPPEIPGEQFARSRYVEAIAETRAHGWRERVFPFLFDRSHWVRDTASELLCLETETDQIEHEIALADRHWWVRFNAASGWFADPDCTEWPEWAPELFEQRLWRERHGIVSRQILALLAKFTPEKVPIEVPTRIREDRDDAVVGLALAEIHLGRDRGWPRLLGLFLHDDSIGGISWGISHLAHASDEDLQRLSNERLMEYLVALELWWESPTAYPNRRAATSKNFETIRKRLAQKTSIKPTPT